MLFEESQHFTKNKLMLLVLILFPVLLIFFGYGLVQQVFFDNPFGSKPMSNMGLSVTLLFLVLLFWWFLQLKLITQVSEAAVGLHYSSLSRFKREIPFASIKDVEIVSYNGLSEHGGWDLRLGKFGVAYTIYGNQAVKLTMHSQKTKPSKTTYIGANLPKL